ncbi:MAG: hypothetical protein K6B46_04930 [Opitutales bacterium]|nr:hypothetical protein [Opitutales bacterium]
MKSLIFIFLLAALFSSSVTAAPATVYEAKQIVFIGDSITQGGIYLKGPVPSYRYQLFKNFVDNGKEFKPMGMTRGARNNVDVSSLTPDYRGIAFLNVSEAAASGRAYQYAGHENERVYKSDPKSVFPPENRGPVTLKLGLKNPFVPGKNQFYDGTELKEYKGETYPKVYGKQKPDTLCILIGINDLYDQAQPDKKIAEHVHEIVRAYQQYNPKIRVFVFEVLPTAADNGTGTKHKNNYGRYNKYLQSLNIEKKWSTGSSKVSLASISRGFYVEDGSMCDGPAGAHPNAQGELIVAGNIARVLGVGQRNAGLKRVPVEKLARPTFEVSGKKIKKTGTGFKIKSAAGDIAKCHYPLPQKGKEHECTLAFTVKMQSLNSPDNCLAASLGNGKNAGTLYVGEKGLFWNNRNNILYGTKDIGNGEKFFTENPVDIRICYLKGDKKGIASGYYVWMDDQLVGEALEGQNPKDEKTYSNAAVIGDFDESTETDATIDNLAVDVKSAVAPTEAKK